MQVNCRFWNELFASRSQDDGHEKNGSLAFEIGSGGFVKKEFPIKELRKIYHIQMKQFRQTNVSTKLRRSMKIDGKLMEDYEIDYQSISREISFMVRDIDDVLQPKGY